MKINVLNSNTENHIFDYQSSVIPRVDEVIFRDDDKGLRVRAVVHKITTHGEPYVDIHCERY